MRKFTATVMVAAAAAIAVGGVLFGAGCAMGGSPGFYYDGDGIHVKERTAIQQREDHVQAYMKLSPVKNLDIRLENADLTIVQGEEWAVEYVLDGYRAEPEYRTENQTLTIREGEWRGENDWHIFSFGPSWWRDESAQSASPYVKITIPKDGTLEQVMLENEYGDIFVEKKLLAKEVSIYAECGAVEMGDWEGDSLLVEEAYGCFTAGRLKGESLIISSESGEVKTGALFVKNADFQMEYGDLSATVEECARVEVENESGSVTLGLVGGMERFGVSLHTDWGTIRTPDGYVEADEMEGNSDFVRKKDDGASIRIHTEYGDIRVREEA